MGRWLGEARRLAQIHTSALCMMPVWLFSSGPIGPLDHLVPARDTRRRPGADATDPGDRLPHVPGSAGHEASAFRRTGRRPDDPRARGGRPRLGCDRSIRRRDRRRTPRRPPKRVAARPSSQCYFCRIQRSSCASMPRSIRRFRCASSSFATRLCRSLRARRSRNTVAWLRVDGGRCLSISRTVEPPSRDCIARNFQRWHVVIRGSRWRWTEQCDCMSGPPFSRAAGP